MKGGYNCSWDAVIGPCGCQLLQAASTISIRPWHALHDDGDCLLAATAAINTRSERVICAGKQE
jgi:hypothetical protein